VWRGPVALAVIAGIALPAQSPTITASDTVFTPGTVTIATGERLTLANAGGTHNFVFQDGAYPPDPAPPDDAAWDGLGRTFAQAGTYAFVCGAHPQMVGSVVVQDPAATPTPTPTPVPSEPPPPTVRSLKLAATTFCIKRCARPGVRVRIDLSQPATVTGTLRRRARGYGRVRFGTVAAGARTLTFRRNAAGRRLIPGRYTLRLRVAGEPQPPLQFRVRR
jgi:plastocyanin